MVKEKESILEQENQSPFSVEKTEEINLPRVEFTNGAISINGVPQEKYLRVDDESFQKNNPDLVYFNAAVGGTEEKNWAGRVIDINNPDKELATITQDKEKNTFVNGLKWDSLRGKDIYWGGYHVEVDPEGKKTVFKAGEGAMESNRTYRVIVNNDVWNTKFKAISVATSVGGITYAFGGSGNENKFAIEDKEWIYNRIENKEYHNGIDEITNVKVNNDGTVVAIINSLRQNNDTRRFISVGDTVGEKHVWKNTFAPAGYERPNTIAVDEERGHIAVLGQVERDGKTALLIDDIPYDLAGNPQKLEYMKFEEGALVIQYTNALAEKITEKISLREDAKEIQEKKEKTDAEENAFENLRRLLAKEHISADEIISRLKKAEALEKETEKTKALSERIGVLGEEKNGLQSRVEQQKKAYEEEIADRETRVADAEIVIKKLEDILKSAPKVTLSSNFKLTPEDMTLALNVIKKQREKYNWPS